MKKLGEFLEKKWKSYILICICFGIAGCSKDKVLKQVTVAEFSKFVDATGYVTDAEKYNWSIVQQTVFKYEIVTGATWKTPDGQNQAKLDYPITQVSYNDAIAYCKWTNSRLPSYEEYWAFAKQDQRTIIRGKTKIHPANKVNIVGNTWDITTSQNQKGEIRLAGGSYLCNTSTCNGTDPNRVLFVSPDTGNTHISFSIIQ